ncbi:hypothetical protein SY2F82_70050 [Streptomyces sp. Y2F8-2]|nr:hypothetical protein SY2F82_70050 [Streptomyces sp. Y2F8-2]
MKPAEEDDALDSANNPQALTSRREQAAAVVLKDLFRRKEVSTGVGEWGESGVKV